MFSPANPPLNEAGKVRALVLRDELKNKNIKHIFSTNYARTLATAEPLANELKLPVQLYNPSKDSLGTFVGKLMTIRNGNVLVVGHSNTIDDLVNELLKEKKFPGDPSDKVYEKMYIIQRKGNKMIYSERIFGYPSNPE
jgi:broad specificity phosphatase PhoE